jgi:hypothetical protein
VGSSPTPSATDDLHLCVSSLVHAYEHIESSLYASELDFEMVAPLAHASFERLPIHLGTDLLIDDMTQEEASLVLNAGSMAPLMGPSDATVLRNRAAVKHRYSLPKRVSSPTEDDVEDKGVHEQVMAFFEKSRRIAEDVLSALRLVHHEQLAIDGNGTSCLETRPHSSPPSIELIRQ